MIIFNNDDVDQLFCLFFCFFFALQNIPKLPIPSVETTLERYLAGLEAVIPRQQLELTKQTVQDFLQSGEANRLQELLTKYDNGCENWASRTKSILSYLSHLSLYYPYHCHCSTASLGNGILFLLEKIDPETLSLLLAESVFDIILKANQKEREQGD